jgi:hypothetical protein
VNDPAPLVFVSYEYEEARRYADQAKEAFESQGYRTWVWHHDRKTHGYVHDDIMDAIEDCDFFLYICTQGSDASTGQSFERDYALGCGKDPPILLAFDDKYIPRMHKKRQVYHNPVTEGNFTEVCAQVADDLSSRPQLERRVAGLAEEAESVE